MTWVLIESVCWRLCMHSSYLRRFIASTPLVFHSSFVLKSIDRVDAININNYSLVRWQAKQRTSSKRKTMYDLKKPYDLIKLCMTLNVIAHCYYFYNNYNTIF